MPLLGDNGTRIVLALRSLGYYNRQTGEKRDGIEIDLPELAALCGISVPTLKREFSERHDKTRAAIPGTLQNPALHQFVKKDRQYWRDPVTNRLLRTANIYRVMMDDPLHADDLPRLQDVLNARGKGAPPSKGQNEPKPPKGRSALPSKAQNDSQNNESESGKSHIHQNKNQNESLNVESEPTLIDYSSVPQKTSKTSEDAPMALPEFSASLFEDQNNPEGSAPSGSSLSLLARAKLAGEAWTMLPEMDRPSWRKQAERELVAIHAGTGITVKPKLIEARAANLYEIYLRTREQNFRED